VALLNAMMHVIVHEGLVDEAFIASRTIGYDDLRRNVEGYSPELMAPICGIPRKPSAIRRACTQPRKAR
jgi:formate dehydrogenase major subunit